MESNKIKAVILGNEEPDDHILWVRSCEKFRDYVDFRVVDLTGNKWFEEIHSQPFDVLLAKPGCVTASYKQLFDERIYILNSVCRYFVFPSADEIFVYENKRFLSYWLKANHVPHPVTDIFYSKAGAKEFVLAHDFPLVGKAGIGAAGSGVRILNNRDEALKYIETTFSGSGAPRRTGPNFSQKNVLKRGSRYLLHPGKILWKLKFYKRRSSNPQKDYILFQEFVPHEFEWRVVRIGDSFFAHKKLKIGDKASGSLLKGYDNPPLSLFDFSKKITDAHNFMSQALDIFETPQGYLINEMQCIFGQSDPYQMLIDGVAGRYNHDGNKWIFEPGDFNTNESYDLRIRYVLERLGRL
jgi:glutathione synthase/RimK-type ligase-like ATP-grasp enzyme